jgi:hypothetical protein
MENISIKLDLRRVVTYPSVRSRNQITTIIASVRSGERLGAKFGSYGGNERLIAPDNILYSILVSFLPATDKDRSHSTLNLPWPTWSKAASTAVILAAVSLRLCDAAA